MKSGIKFIEPEARLFVKKYVYKKWAEYLMKDIKKTLDTKNETRR